MCVASREIVHQVWPPCQLHFYRRSTPEIFREARENCRNTSEVQAWLTSPERENSFRPRQSQVRPINHVYIPSYYSHTIGQLALSITGKNIRNRVRFFLFPDPFLFFPTPTSIRLGSDWGIPAGKQTNEGKTWCTPVLEFFLLPLATLQHVGHSDFLWNIVAHMALYTFFRDISHQFITQCT